MKKIVIFSVRLILSCLLLWYLLSQIDLAGMYSVIKSAEVGWLVLAFLLLLVGKVISSYRWRVLLDAHNIRIPLRNLVISLFVGQFFNNFLPTTVGGDVIRVYDAAAYSKEAAKSATSVVVDRLLGVIALVLLALLAILAALWLKMDVMLSFIWIVVALALACLLFLWVILNDNLMALLAKSMHRLPLRKINSMIDDAHKQFQLLKHDKRSLGLAFGASLVLQINVVMFYYLISMSIDLPVSLLYHFIFVPLSLVILLVPISINGIGLREGVYVFMLSRLGVSAPDAVAFSWIAFGLMLTQGVIGGIFFAIRDANLKQLQIGRFHSAKKSSQGKRKSAY